MPQRPSHPWRPLIIAVVALALGACGSVPRTERPAEVESRGAEVPVPSERPARTPQIAAYTPPAAPQYARPQPSRAVQVLKDRATDQQRQGDYSAATVSLERALRIAPNDAELWHQLADVRFDQQRYDLVAQLAAKSNSLAAPEDLSLQRANWSMIARARESLGDSAGAREAQRRADSF